MSARKEDSRHSCLAFLANRPAVSFSAEAVRRGINREGGDFTLQETREALELLTGLSFATAVPDKLGATLYYQASAAGVIQFERGQ